MWEIAGVEDNPDTRVTILINTEPGATVTTDHRKADVLASTTNPSVPVRLSNKYTSFTGLPVRIYVSVSPIHKEG